MQQKAVELATQLVVENKKRVEVGALAPWTRSRRRPRPLPAEAALIAARSALAVQEHLVKQLITDEYSPWANRQPGTLRHAHRPRQFFNLQDSWSKG